MTFPNTGPHGSSGSSARICSGTRATLDRLGAVLVAGCRDHQAARTLGFMPRHGVTAALEMAHGRAGGEARIGFLLAPPYFPLEVEGR